MNGNNLPFFTGNRIKLLRGCYKFWGRLYTKNIEAMLKKLARNRGVFMNFSKSMSDAIEYLMAAFARIFAPTDDAYPLIGVQPFEGDPYKGSRWAE